MSGLAAVSSWLFLGSLAAAVGSFVLAGYLCRRRDDPGAVWFMGTLSAQGLFCLLSAVSLTVPATGPRLFLEGLALAALCWTGPLFFAFVLEYTGRGGLVDGWTVVPVTALGSVVVVTAPVHDLVFAGFRVESTAGAATAAYALAPWGLFALLFGTGLATVGVGLLVHTILSYGPLYRREAAAVSLSTVAPLAALGMWLFDLGPAPSLATVAVAFVPHVLLDGYAFVESGMFETNPTTRRAADRTAVDDIGTPMLILDTDGRVVDYNAAADPLLESGRDGTTLLGTRVRSLVDLDGDPATDGGTAPRSSDAPSGGRPDELVSVSADGHRREFLVSRSPLTDPKGTAVGTTLVFQDVTRERRREQRLDVFNRVLRHNLRNKLTAVTGNAQLIASRSDDDGLADMAATIDSSARELIAIGEKARSFEQCRRDGPHYRSVALAPVLTDAVAEHRDGSGRVSLSVDDDLRVTTDPALLDLVVDNLVENAVEHVADPTVSVAASVADGALTLSVTDDGPGIPESELTPFRAGGETQLRHSTGIGLWVVQWSVTSLGGRLSFDTDDGTTVTVTLPDGAGPTPATDPLDVGEHAPESI